MDPPFGTTESFRCHSLFPNKSTGEYCRVLESVAPPYGVERATGERTFDELLDALGHIQRRTLLRALLVHNPQGDDSVKVDGDESDEEELERLVGMKHVHLPKLESHGFISWNRDTNEVSKGPNFVEIRPLLETLAAHEDELPDGWV